MKKFKVIEKSRFLSDDKLSDIKGGDIIPCPGRYPVLCSKNHAVCSGIPASYFSGPCAGNKGTCGIFTLYDMFCATINESCGPLVLYESPV